MAESNQRIALESQRTLMQPEPQQQQSITFQASIQSRPLPPPPAQESTDPDDFLPPFTQVQAAPQVAPLPARPPPQIPSPAPALPQSDPFARKPSHRAPPPVPPSDQSYPDQGYPAPQAHLVNQFAQMNVQPQDHNFSQQVELHNASPYHTNDRVLNVLHFTAFLAKLT
jgi:hypothetical protein